MRKQFTVAQRVPVRAGSVAVAAIGFRLLSSSQVSPDGGLKFVGNPPAPA